MEDDRARKHTRFGSTYPGTAPVMTNLEVDQGHTPGLQGCCFPFVPGSTDPLESTNQSARFGPSVMEQVRGLVSNEEALLLRINGHLSLIGWNDVPNIEAAPGLVDRLKESGLLGNIVRHRFHEPGRGNWRSMLCCILSDLEHSVADSSCFRLRGHS